MAIDQESIDPQRQYRVVLNQRINIIDAQTTLYPEQDIEMCGDLVVIHAEAIDSATPI